jgi:hypothetical protein
MAAADLTAWRKLNSDPLTIDIVLVDGSQLRAIVMLPREKTLPFVFNIDTPFLEVECLENGPIVFALSSIRSARPSALPKAEQLERRLKAIEKLGVHAVLNVKKTASKLEVVDAYHAAKAPYELDEAIIEVLPEEVRDYVRAMNRRIDQAALELLGTFPVEQTTETIAA